MADIKSENKECMIEYSSVSFLTYATGNAAINILGRLDINKTTKPKSNVF